MNDLALAGAAPPARIERLTAALAPATRDSYRNGWRKWEAFAREIDTPALPAPPEALAAFVESLARAGARPSTFRAALAAVSAAHRLAGAASSSTATAVGERPILPAVNAETPAPSGRAVRVNAHRRPSARPQTPRLRVVDQFDIWCRLLTPSYHTLWSRSFPNL